MILVQNYNFNKPYSASLNKEKKQYSFISHFSTNTKIPFKGETPDFSINKNNLNETKMLFQNHISEIFSKDRILIENNKVMHSTGFKNKNNRIKNSFELMETQKFKHKFHSNPLLMKKENIDFAFSLTEEMLKVADRNEYNEIFENLDTLSEGFYENNYKQVSNSWNKLSKNIEEYWENIVLVDKNKQNEANLKKLDVFLNSDYIELFKNTTVVESIFKNSYFSLNEKSFLIDKQKDIFGYDLCKFLVENPTNNQNRKQIINNIMRSEKFADENFTQIKDFFIEDVKNENFNSIFLNKRLNNTTLINNILLQTPANYKLHLMDEGEKIKYLKKLPIEKLNTLLENSRKEWISEQVENSYEVETNKYDISQRFDTVMENLVFDIDGKKVNLYELTNQIFTEITGQQIDIKNANAQILAKTVENSLKLNTQEQRINKGFNTTSLQLSQIAQSIFENKKQMDVLNLQMSKVLDKMERQFPEKRTEIENARNFLTKVKDGVFKNNTILNGYFTMNAVLAIGKTLTASGEPTLMSIGAILIALALGTKTIQNFNKGYNGGNL